MADKNKYAGVRWPVGYPSFYGRIITNTHTITNGTLLAIDPSSGSKSSQPGYALYKGGALVDSGIIKIPFMLAIEGRLRVLYDKLAEFGPIDVLCVEEIKQGLRHHQFLDYAIGVTLAGCRAQVYFAVPIMVWKALAKVDGVYAKTDSDDAVMIGGAVVHLAKHGP